MTTEEKSVQKALGTYLPAVWKEVCKLTDEGHELIAKGGKLRVKGWKLFNEGHALSEKGRKIIAKADKLQVDGFKLIADGYRLRDKGEKLIAEGDKLHVEGWKLFTGAVDEVYGKKITITWISYGCKLSNDVEFRY